MADNHKCEVGLSNVTDPFLIQQRDFPEDEMVKWDDVF